MKNQLILKFLFLTSGYHRFSRFMPMPDTFSVLRIPNYLFAGLAHRPRKILLFVNPFGGKKKGLKIWEKDVQPLMTIAGIDTKMLVTERVGHARDTLLSVDLSDFHASFILCFVLGAFAVSFIFG